MNGQGFLRFEPRVGGFGFGGSGFLKACLRFAGVRDVEPQSYGFFSGLGIARSWTAGYLEASLQGSPTLRGSHLNP